ncbi:phosphoenolpyruvate synthase [Kingella kingae]|uniref:Phosphoenolpyruvate synthase n=5 Tax=Kingella kingae TaxID=504 RepID=F5S7W2_KINKI|nr:phosphoenolpyruvate synthase [Kingella kingae]EGK08604.1 phosphoenolpyruvate synthase [Kingella kingae ATCC 23330]MDK4533955.1 phosphoenolpyruvate synthase [Kingella kingae]MDK4540346.1 phosphoenolpyruvate synthase [Kingella kingae]MDK4552987.1 phosphoenolpyruvate synthase [Kingella kingae]UOP02756.1 phosphoenolpyruvate synthase [Kingella kingae]
MSQNVIWFENLRMTDVESVGGKNASLGEMISQLANKGVRVPSGFATTAAAYRAFLAHEGLADRISAALAALDVDDVTELARVGKEIRQWILETPFPAELNADIETAWNKMVADAGTDQISVAVRSSATAEDLPDASFAGQQETFLNINGLENVKEAMHHVFASLYNDRAISYRVHKGFAHDIVALSAGVQRMVRSDSGAAGVMFSIDTESGFEDVVFVTSSYGLGETVVQGAVNPDEFYVHKPTLRASKPAILRKTMGSKLIKMTFTDSAQAGKSVQVVDVPANERKQFSISNEEITELAKYALIIEEHYGRPMDIEWGRDGVDGKLYILQARPETVKSQEKEQGNSLRRYTISGERKVLCEGRAIGQKVGQGKVRLVKDASEMDSVQAGDILVTDMTDPDWEPVMKRAAAIVTNRGGRTCHAAIIARELGIPAVVGCGNASHILQEGQEVTVSCAEGDTGLIYEGLLNVNVDEVALDNMPKAPVKIMMNVGNPELAFSFASIPSEGIGLARMEFIINRQIGIHPKALIDFNKQDADLQNEIRDRIAGYTSPKQFYVDKIAEGVATLAASVYPRKVIVRMSDFKSNEYAGLVGGNVYEPHEENPMLGFRGAARYVSEDFKEAFALECQALKYVRDEMGLTNVEIMIPFVRTLSEAEQVIHALKANGLERGKNGLRLIMMCEVPSNALLAEQFLKYFDGFSIGSNDMTQLTLGVDRDSGGPIASTFDERNAAVKVMFHLAISACRKHNKYVGICGQGPSDHPDFAKWLVEEGIETISLNPDTVIETWLYLAKELGDKAAA